MTFHPTRKHRRPAPPTEFPTSVTYHRGALNFDFMVKDEDAYYGFLANAGGLDGASLNGLVVQQRDTSVSPVTVEELRENLAEGREWREPRRMEPDGQKETCARCGQEFQPVLIPWGSGEKSGTGGNCRTAKADELKGLPPEVQDLANDLTSRLFTEAGESVPEGLTTRALAMCEDCRKHEINNGMRPHFFKPRGEMVTALLERDSSISSAINRKQRTSAFDGAFQRRQQRPEKGKWQGALFHKGTADALAAAEQAGTVSSLDDVIRMSPEQIVQTGIAPDEDKALGVRRAAERGRDWLQRQQTIEAVGGSGSATLAEHTGGIPEATPSRKRQRPNKGKAKGRRESGGYA